MRFHIATLCLFSMTFFLGADRSGGNTWGEVQKITASDGAASDIFGVSVAVDQDTAVVGAPFDNAAAGSAYIFQRQGAAADSWAQVAKITAPDGETEDEFGASVSISGDTVAVGAYGDDDGFGAAFIFERNQGGIDNWGLVKKLRASDPALNDFFGRSVSISGDTIAVGAYLDDDAGSASGSAYIFERNKGGVNVWGEVSKLAASDAAPGDIFGFSVAIDQSSVVVGAPKNQSAGFNSGSAYVFERDHGGQDAWGEVAKLIASDTTVGDEFSYSTAISGDLVVVGAYFNDSAGSNSGSAYIFERDHGGQDAWGEAAKLTASDAEANDQFGLAVAAGHDLVAVGVASDNNARGAAYLFGRDEGGQDAWGEMIKLTASDAMILDGLGWSVSLEEDILFAGSHRDDDNGDDAGSSYIFSTQGRLDVVDASSFIDDHSVTTDPQTLATGGITRTGAATDGVTRILLRYTSPEPGTVSFIVDNPPSENGGVDIVGGDGRFQNVEIATLPTTEGHQAFAVYRVPDEYGSTLPSARRNVRFYATFTPSGAGVSVSHTTQIDLVRPPLVFVHGLWSGPETWTMPLFNDSRFLVRRAVDYKMTHAHPFSENVDKVPLEIADALDEMRDLGIASTQVDVIAHSMGGILSRIWSTNPEYLSDESYGQGSMRKLMTLDTPHFGTPAAEQLVDRGPALTALMRRLNRPIDDGAIENLAPGSSELQSLEASPVPAHALVGTGGLEDLVEADGLLGKMFQILIWIAGDITGTTLYDGENHDYLVAESSQKGGIAESATTTFSSLDGNHLRNTGSTLYSLALENLVQTPVTNSVFSTFPASPTAQRVPRVPKSQSTLGTGSLTIVAPVPGAVVSPGDVVSVIVEGSDGFIPASVLVTGEHVTTAEVDDGAPFELDLTIGDEAIGTIEITAIGRDAQNSMVFSEPLSLTIEQTATLESIRISPETIILRGTFDEESVAVFGLYSDGIEREIAPSVLGTTYSIDFPNIATVSAEGSVTSRQQGEATLAATNENHTGTSEVLVLDGVMREIFLDGFESGDISAW